jgi:hypothetical protein
MRRPTGLLTKTAIVFSCLVLTGCQSEPPYTTSKACAEYKTISAQALQDASQNNGQPNKGLSDAYDDLVKHSPENLKADFVTLKDLTFGQNFDLGGEVGAALKRIDSACHLTG